MAKVNKPVPKRQSQLSQDSIETYNNAQKQPTPDSLKNNRAYNRSVKGDDVKQFSIGLKDIDQTILFYFNNVIKPSVIQNAKRIPVPILYGSPERWASVQKDGFYRDKNGKIQTPLIMFKRDSVEKNRTLGNKLDANSPNNFGIFQKKFSKKNIYDRFSTLTTRIPVTELYGVIIPDYVNIVYSCIIFTEYVEQMNNIVESINFASDAYWGDPERFSFRAMIDTYTTTTEMNQGEDRTIKTSFNINMMGHVVPDTINASIGNMNKFYSKSSVKFGIETAGTQEILNARAKTPERTAPITRFYDSIAGKSVTTVNSSGMSDEERTYLTLSRVLETGVEQSTISTENNTILFEGFTISPTPTNFPPLTSQDFQVFINGVKVEPSAIDSITSPSTGILIQFNIDLGYSITDQMNLIAVGKFITI